MWPYGLYHKWREKWSLNCKHLKSSKHLQTHSSSFHLRACVPSLCCLSSNILRRFSFSAHERKVCGSSISTTRLPPVQCFAWPGCIGAFWFGSQLWAKETDHLDRQVDWTFVKHYVFSWYKQINNWILRWLKATLVLYTLATSKLTCLVLKLLSSSVQRSRELLMNPTWLTLYTPQS